MFQIWNQERLLKTHVTVITIYVITVIQWKSKLSPHFHFLYISERIKVKTDLHTWILREMILLSIASVSFLTLSALLESIYFTQATLWPKIIVHIHSKSKKSVIFTFLARRADQVFGGGGGGEKYSNCKVFPPKHRDINADFKCGGGGDKME